MFGFLSPPAGPLDLSDAGSETDTSSTFSRPSYVGRQECHWCGGGGIPHVSAWTQTEPVVEEESNSGDAALAAWQGGCFPTPPQRKRNGGTGRGNLLITILARPDPQIPAARAAFLSSSTSKETADLPNPIATCAATTAAALAHASSPQAPSLPPPAPTIIAPALASALQVAAAVQKPPPVTAPTSPTTVNSISKNALTAASLAHTSSLHSPHPRPQSLPALPEKSVGHTFHAAALSMATTARPSSPSSSSPSLPDLTRPPRASVEKRKDPLALMATAQQNVRAHISLLESSTLRLPSPDQRVQVLAEEKVRPAIDDITRAAEERRAKGADDKGKKRAREAHRQQAKTAKLEGKRIKGWETPDAEKAHAKLLKAQEKTTRREEKQRQRQERQEVSSIFTANTTNTNKKRNPFRTLISKISQQTRRRSPPPPTNPPQQTAVGRKEHCANALDLPRTENHSLSSGGDLSEEAAPPPTEAAIPNTASPLTTAGQVAERRAASLDASSGNRSSVGSRFMENL